MSDAVVRAYVVTLTIPDNEAYTALTTLARMGVPVDAAVRAESVSLRVDAEHAAALDRTHRARSRRFTTRTSIGSRCAATPARDRARSGSPPVDEAPAIPHRGAHRRRRAGRRAPHGLAAVDERGADVPAEVLDRATETLLCNPAFQRAIL